MSQISRILLFLTFGTILAADLNPAAIRMTLPKDIPWVETAANATAIMTGDPAKPGIYVELMRWKAGNMSRPHFHPNDRYIYVIQGPWWVGTERSTIPAAPSRYPRAASSRISQRRFTTTVRKTPTAFSKSWAWARQPRWLK